MKKFLFLLVFIFGCEAGPESVVTGEVTKVVHSWSNNSSAVVIKNSYGDKVVCSMVYSTAVALEKGDKITVKPECMGCVFYKIVPKTKVEKCEN